MLGELFSCEFVDILRRLADLVTLDMPLPWNCSEAARITTNTVHTKELYFTCEVSCLPKV